MIDSKRDERMPIIDAHALERLIFYDNAARLLGL